ncbi:hypothetical protein MPLA_140223 [Mesorhizobium sp. ORS 3359]|nr:hypothetical protein MPLA_140223 [Mesorhizobium sp. ORS 3359]
MSPAPVCLDGWRVRGRVARRLKAHHISVKDFPWEHLPNPRGKTGRREMSRTERWPSG